MTSFEDEASPFYDNRGLFSDHFLLERLPHLPEWREAEIQAAFERAREIYEANAGVLGNLNEAETEEEFIRPILGKVLGWSYGVQKAQRYQGRLRRPDYGLFLDEATKKSALAQEDSRDYWARAAGVADAKYWARPLDGDGDPDRERFPELSATNPSMQIVSYLIATGCDWGFLTNGKHWRLYSTRARSRIDTYYEVDLKRILREGDADAFRRFYLLFRAEAFRVEADSASLRAKCRGLARIDDALLASPNSVALQRFMGDGFTGDYRVRGQCIAAHPVGLSRTFVRRGQQHIRQPPRSASTEFQTAGAVPAL